MTTEQTMTTESAAALRAEFPAATVGKLPKPYKADSPRGQCRDCGGYHGLPAVHLDYVGHAATTDRLLQVDPAWSWEPFAVDVNGLPALDQRGNLWIRLTVCGVTRIGVGDGKSLKEIIGDAIRNAAMRFGVALDLWAKEDLHAARTEQGQPPESESSDVGQPPAEPTPAGGTRKMSRGAIAPAQSRAMHASFNDAGITQRDARLDYCRNLIGRQIESSNDLTSAEASRILNALKADLGDTDLTSDAARTIDTATGEVTE